MFILILSRLDHILILLVLILASISTVGAFGNPLSQDQEDNLSEMTAAQVVPLLQSRKIPVEKYVSLLLERAKVYGGPLNAFITLEKDSILNAARRLDEKLASGAASGALFGVPVSLKDLISTSGTATTFGTIKYQNFLPNKNAPLVDKLIAADAIIFGKNNNQEWAFGSNGYNSHYGQQLNPYDKERIAGGSSGGGAAAVAARIVPIAIGSDTAASIRVPAAFTGLFGFRPTTGRYPTAGVAPISQTLDTVGPLARSAEDLMLIDEVLADDKGTFPEIRLDGLRLGVPKRFFQEGVSQELLEEFDFLLEELEKRQVVLVDADLPNVTQLNEEGLYPILFYETYPAVNRFLAEWVDGSTVLDLLPDLGWDTKLAWQKMVIPGAPASIPLSVYQSAIDEIKPDLESTYSNYFETHGVEALIFPATVGQAPLAKPENPQEDIIDGETVSIFLHDRNSSPGALAGQPGIAIPLGLSKQGLPLAISLDGKKNDDRRLLSIGKLVSTIVPRLPGPYEH